MKKIVIIVLLPVFLLSTTIGVTMTSLYCNGEISKTGFSVKACCEDVNKGGCCKTESKLIKIEDDFLKTSASFDLVTVSDLYLSSGNVSFITDVKPVSHFKFYSDKAPPLKGAPLYILFRSLII